MTRWITLALFATLTTIHIAANAAPADAPTTAPAAETSPSAAPPATRPTDYVKSTAVESGPHEIGATRPIASVDAASTATQPASIASADATQPSTRPSPLGDADDKLSVTRGAVNIAGADIAYTATAGTMALKNDDGKPWANVFFVSYEKDEPADFDYSARPITFVFNGGPGSAAVWLQIGALGPRRIKLAGAGLAPEPPYKLINNDQSWLDLTDLVFIDPVGTGFSRPADGVKQEEFSGSHGDIESVADFIRLFLTRSKRWLSPKFLTGESYGTTRAAGLSDWLLNRYGIELNGIVFVSSVLDFQTLNAASNNYLPFELYLPSYTALAIYHKKIPAPKDENALLAEVSRFVLGDYAAALAQGENLPADQRAGVVRKLAAYTGLAPDFIDRSDLKISPDAFRKQLLNDRREVIGRFDGRIVGQDVDPAADSPELDPSFSRYYPIYAELFNNYLQNTLKFESDLPYEVLTGKVQPWKMEGDPGEGYFTVADNLRDAMTADPHLKVFFAMGSYDLATPFFSQQYTISQMGLPAPLRGNVTQKRYPGGHMLYHVPEALKAFKADVAKFMREAAPPADGMSK